MDGSLAEVDRPKKGQREDSDEGVLEDCVGYRTDDRDARSNCSEAHLIS